MAASLRALRADLYALQEVDRRVVRSFLRDQTRLAARATATQGYFARARPLGPGGSYGNALLVRGRTLRRSVLELPSEGEPRVALVARVVVGDVELTAVSTHLQNRRAGRPDEAPVQLRFLLEELARWPEPWVLCGDLNLRSPTVLPLLADAGLDAADTPATFPAARPNVRIDWVAVRGLEVVAASVPDLRTSDHRPVVAQLRPSPADGSGDGIRT
jgi:endonuclease/exonuclease/phosphatase family metal-dependent hydrolase